MLNNYNKIARLISRKFDVQVIATEDECKTDSNKIYIPMLADRFEGDNRIALDGMIDHESFHIRASREDDKLKRKNSFMFLKDGLTPNVHSVVNAILDSRDEAFGRSIYPGSAYNIRRMIEVIDRKPESIKDIPSLIYSLLNGMTTMEALTDTQKEIITPFVKHFEDARSIVNEFKSPQEVINLAKKIVKDVQKGELSKKETSSKSKKNSKEGKGSKESKDGKEGEEAKENGKFKPSEYIFEKARKKVSEAAISIIDRATRDGVREHLPNPKALARDKEIDPLKDRSYLKPCDEESFEQLLGKMSDQTGVLVNNVRRLLLGRAIDRKRYSRDRGALDTSALYKVRYDNRLFTRIEKGININSAVSILGDMSGSMCGPKENVTRSALVIISHLLNSLSVPFEILGWDTMAKGIGGDDKGFTTIDFHPVYNRDAPMRYYVFKSFSQLLNNDAKKRISLFRNQRDNNVDSEAILWAALRLARRKEKNRILIVLSDGTPCCPGTDWSIDGDNIKTVVKKCQKAGFKVGGIGIQSDAVSYYYPTYEVIEDLSQLGSGIATMFRKLQEE